MAVWAASVVWHSKIVSKFKSARGGQFNKKMSQITTKTPITDQEPIPVCLSPHIYMSFVSRSSPARKQNNPSANET
jgi:hypothetical protein